MLILAALFIWIELLKADVILEQRAYLRLERLGHLSALKEVGMHAKASNSLHLLVMEIMVASKVASISRTAFHRLSSFLSVGS